MHFIQIVRNVFMCIENSLVQFRSHLTFIRLDMGSSPQRAVACQEFTDNELVVTSTSPFKFGDVYMLDLEKNAKKRLSFEHGNAKSSELLTLTNSTNVDGQDQAAVDSTEQQIVKNTK